MGAIKSTIVRIVTMRGLALFAAESRAALPGSADVNRKEVE